MVKWNNRFYIRKKVGCANRSFILSSKKSLVQIDQTYQCIKLFLYTQWIILFELQFAIYSIIGLSSHDSWRQSRVA